MSASNKKNVNPGPESVSLRGRRRARDRGAPRRDREESAVSRSSVSSANSVVRQRDVRSYAANFRLTIPKSDQNTIDFAVRSGWKFQAVDVPVNGHPISHLSRDRFVLDVLFKEGAKKQTICVLDYCGSGRNKKFENGLVKFHNYQPYAVSGDVSRSLVERSSEMVECDFAIIQDVYFGPNGPLTPSDVLSIAQTTKTGRVYICARVFLGVAGGDRGLNEGVWVRGKDGIVFSPELGMPSYSPHPDINWILDRSCTVLDVSPLDTCGPFQVTRCSVPVVGAKALMPFVYPSGLVEERELVSRSFWSFFMARDRRQVHLPTLCGPARKFLGRNPSGIALDSCVAMVTSSFGSDATMKNLQERFPNEYMRIFDDTVKACLYYGRSENTQQLDFLRQWFARDETRLVSVRNTSSTNGAVFVFPRHARPLSLVTLGLGVGLAVVLGKRRLGLSWFNNRVWRANAPWLEETCKCWFPLLAVPCVLWEVVRGRGSDRWVSATFHGLSMIGYSLFGAWMMPATLAFHFWWNKKVDEHNVWVQFQERYADGIRDFESSAMVPLPVGTSLPSFTTRAVSGPRHFRGKLSVQVAGQDLGIAEALCLLPEGGLNCTWPLLATNGLLWQPANNARNLLAAAVWRTHNDPFVGFPSFPERLRRWYSLRDIFDTLVDREVTELLSVAECAQLMGKRGKRILIAYERVLRGDLNRFSKTITLKWNETLPVDKDCNGVLTLKPRAIINLDPRLHALMAPYSRAMTDVMHSIFDGRVHVVAGVSVKIYFAAGYTHEDLCALGNDLVGPDVVVAASGDDSVVSWGSFGRGRASPFAEADQSKFDHTQDEGPLSLSTFWMRRLGAPEWFIDLVLFCCREGYTSRKHDFSSRGISGTQMPTGITLTTLLNSMATIAMYLYAIESDSVDLVARARELGFGVKMVQCDDITQLTFLKGWWQCSDVGLVWLPLPSAVVKLGKLIRSPLEIASTKDWNLAYQRCAFALARSYGTIPLEYPILGPFLECLLKYGKEWNDAKGMPVLESWKPVVSLDFKIDASLCRSSIIKRYGIDDCDLLRAEALIQQVRQLPAYLEDYVFLRLSVVDY